MSGVLEGGTVAKRPHMRHRRCISITKIITDKDGKELGKLVTLYAHVELDPDTGYGFGQPENHGLRF